MTMRFVILAVVSASAGMAQVAIRDGCSEDSAIVATAAENEPMTVLHGVNGGSLACYAVSMMRSEKEIHGYLLDSKAPVVQEFVRKHVLESRVEMPQAPPTLASGAAQHETATGPPFEPWSGVGINGQKLKIDGSGAKVTLVILWSAESAAGRRAAQEMMTTESQFRSQGLKVYGLVQAASTASLLYRLDDMGLDYPQAMDRQGMAAKYQSDGKGTALVIDSTNHIVLNSSNAAEVRAAIRAVLGLTL
jgi:hypothetical protein